MATQPITWHSPKQEFQSVADRVSKHREMVDSAAFSRAMDYAQREYVGYVQSQIKDEATATAAGYKIQGMMEFCACLRMLSENPVIVAQRPVGNLNHNQ